MSSNFIVGPPISKKGDYLFLRGPNAHMRANTPFIERTITLQKMDELDPEED